ncbi:MAG: hypothetical protein HY266_00925 [Deltaproteobacteria bacterium]|nr:hypothetical protein [Deltaproteobacteria bacterium]
MKNILKTVIVLAGVVAPLLAQTVFAQTEETKMAEGIKATLNVVTSSNMVDLMLISSKTGKVITDAKVFTKIKGPDGKVQEKDLLGMQMGEVFSYMNNVDMAKKGSYSFDISVEIGKKKVKFNFVYEVK